LKKRAREKTLILFPKNHRSLAKLVKKISLSALKLISHWWPGPLTLIFEANISEPWCLVSQEGKIGIRIPSHPVPRKISQEEILLATTSANLSGAPPVGDPEYLSFEIRKGVDLLVDSGPTPLGRESTVVDVTTSPPRILREGQISEDEIKKVIEEEVKILFICTGNTCRSVMAEALFKKIWSSKNRGKVRVSSAGTYAISSSPPSRYTQVVMKKRGINVNSYRSTYAGSNLINQSDLILVMEKKHLQHLTKLCPEAEVKIWMLKEFASKKEEEILDPMGGSEKSYEETLQEIEQEIRKMVERLSES